MIEITVDGKIYEVYGKDEDSSNKNPHIIDKETGEIAKNQRLIVKKFLVSIGKHTKEYFELINIISKKTEPKDSSRLGKRHFSFASKFCHYTSYFLFENEPEQDNFSIYDNVLTKAIPKYIDYYNLEKLKNINISDYDKYYKSEGKAISEFYKVYYDAIGEIIKASGSGISRNGFDHLLWYYYKGRL